MDRDPIRYILLLVGVVLYVASLASEAVTGYGGYFILLFGWAEVGALREVGPAVALAWYANPLLWVAWFLGTVDNTRAREAGRILACMAAFLGLSYIIFGNKVVTNESGMASTLVTSTTGYQLWIASILFATARAFLPSGKRE